MDKNKICEELYSLPGGMIERRRKSLLMPGLLFIAGVALIVVNNLFGEAISNNVSSALVFIGGAMALAGLIMLAARLFASQGVPYYKDGRCFLRYDELYFEPTSRGEMLQSIADGEVAKLLAMKHAQVPVLTVAIYRTPDNRFAALQAFEYADLEYRPLTGLKVVGM